MGNEACCEQYPTYGFGNHHQSLNYLADQKEKKLIQKTLKQELALDKQLEEKLSPHQNNIWPPPLNTKVQKSLIKNSHLQKYFNFKPEIRLYGQEIYEGRINVHDRPDGYGKFYKADQSYYMGQFIDGKAHGEGLYILPDGSYYLGQFENNFACSREGYFWSEDLEYQGGFELNCFHGNGREKGVVHEFQGIYDKGKKRVGVYKWADVDGNYCFEGNFDENQNFIGQGKLTQPLGQYEGSFKDGEKHGKGVYRYANGLRYEGDYFKGEREGKGVIYNNIDTIAYEGEIKKGVPHGQGFVYSSKGERMSTKWVEGVSSQSLI